ncbi:unnamed protein product [[Candida] boidinii]|uniref:Unnamed protein product n=1 Tax=Candida boidinii TaxID=5477 RepID=A0A9W6WD12_CANBO|nr:unnamed protein product [[Candida] boidinii]
MNSRINPFSLIINSSSIFENASNSQIVGENVKYFGNETHTRNNETGCLGRVICVISESTSIPPVVGICFVDISSTDMTITQLIDSPTYVRTIHKISVFGPTEIIVSNASKNFQGTHLVEILEENITESTKLISISQKHFVPVNHFKVFIRSLKETDKSSLINQLKSQHYALCAINAAIQYLIQVLGMNLSAEAFHVKLEASEETMFIDETTRNSLALVNPLSEENGGLSVLKFLNCCCTPMGARLLQNNILQPITNKESLTSRYEAVKELAELSNNTIAIRKLLKSLPDTDHLFFLVRQKKPISLIPATNEKKINIILLLKEAVQTFILIGSELDSYSSNLLAEIRLILKHQDLLEILENISSKIEEDCHWASKPLELRNLQCTCIKSGINGLLDLNRQLYQGLVEEIVSLSEKLSETYHTNLELKFDLKRLFYFSVKSSFDEINALPEIFIKRLKKRSAIECVTLDLIKLNARLNGVSNEIFLMCDSITEGIIADCRQFISTCFLVSEAISTLDFIGCLAFNSIKATRSYTTPEIGKSLLIKNARHPILETLKNLDFVANDYSIDEDSSRLQIITGTNMSGKTVYIKSLALIVIMAQIGSLVPADYAHIKIYRSLHARLPCGLVQESASTFSSEMSDMAFILKQVSSEPSHESLVIIDELGRGTSYSDGFSLSLAIAEKLLSYKNCSTLMTTHFIDIARRLNNNVGVKLLLLETNSKDHRYEMSYKVSSGINGITGYGITLLNKLEIFPEDMLAMAQNVSRSLRESKKDSLETIKRKKKNLLMKGFYTGMAEISHSKYSKENMIAAIKNLEFKFIKDMAKLRKIQHVNDEFSISDNSLTANSISVHKTVLDTDTTTTLIDFNLKS